MKRRLFFLLFLTAVPLALGADLALEKRVVEHTCANGIKLLIVERHFSPTVSIRMMFRTGSVDEVSGKTGLAHMFEHMMFKGTKTLGTKNYAAEIPLLRQIDELHQAIDREKEKGNNADQKQIGELIDQVRVVEEKADALVASNELWSLYEREGASTLNANTADDYTQYMVDLPSNKIELWAILDSDRVKNPVFRQFYQEREVVKEERRMRVDTNPDGKLYEAFIAAAYTSHPYRNPTIGWESDLDHLYVSDLTDFYKKHYTPEALTIAVVGDVKTADVIAMVDKYFGTWHVLPAARNLISNEPPQTGPRRVNIKFEAQPHVLLGYHIPSYPDPDQMVSFAVSHLLGAGTTSRLYKALVEKKKVATSVETGQDYPGERYPSLFIFSAAPRFPHTNDDAAKVIEQELERLKKEPVQDWELEKIRSAVEVGILDTLQTNSGMASTLVYNQTVFGDWRYLLAFQKQMHELKTADLQNFAKKYFVKENETVGVLESIKKDDQHGKK
jgi:predicted Zn-dependent peptidase